MEYPKGNAQIGDHVWIKPVGKKLFQKHWKIVEVGARNAHGYLLDVLAVHEVNAEARQVSPYPRLQSGEEQVLVVPRVETLPAALRVVLEKYPDLVAYRDGGNSDDERFRIYCTTCGHAVYTRIESVETADLRFYSAVDRFEEGKLDLDECGTDVICHCEDVEYYDIEFERYS